MRASVTRAAEGFDRRSFTVDEVLRRQEAGILSEDENFEPGGPMARIYARHGVQEFWVVDAAQRRTYVHRAPSGESWTETSERGPDDALSHPALPGFSLKLADV
jgi:hypothetical protein